ncbi:MAG: sulfatase [Balneolaceae bacterium]|nr:sulfatase [Balneolaceae bacterium]
MNRFSIQLTFLLQLAVFAAIISCSNPAESIKPNIVWIIAEDLSQDLGAYGNVIVNTPNIDQLAQKGVTFANVFTTSPVCSPSRTALATGMYQTSIGAYHMRYPDLLKPELPDSIQTVHQIFRNNGYVTANIQDEPATGKTDWMFQADLDKSFDLYHWDELTNQDKPFFAQVSVSNTHRPFPEVDENEALVQQVEPPPYYPDNIVVRKDWAGYYKSAAELDEKIGQIISTLREKKLDNNTIVLFYSDHGRPMTRGKYWNYDSGTRVPMIIHIPDNLSAPSEYQAGKKEDQLISHIDITATTLSLAGIKKPAYMQGRVFWGNNKDPEREYVYSASDRIGELYFRSRAIRSHNYKYIRNYHNDFSINEASTAYRRAYHPIYHVLNILHEKGELNADQQLLVESLPEEELYNLNEDPYELNNLVDDPEYSEELNRLRNELDSWMESVQDKGMNEDSEAIIKAFDQYGKESLERYQEQINQVHQQVKKQLE